MSSTKCDFVRVKEYELLKVEGGIGMMEKEEQIVNERFAQVMQKIAFLAELKKYFYQRDSISFDEVLEEEKYYLVELQKLLNSD